MTQGKKETPAGTEVLNTEICQCCKDVNGELKITDDKFICYTCAQIQSELGHERS